MKLSIFKNSFRINRKHMAVSNGFSKEKYDNIFIFRDTGMEIE